MIAAPTTPARSPSCELPIRRSRVAIGSDRPERHLAHAREELLVRLGQVAAEDDGARVEEVDALGEHLAERAAGLAHRVDGRGSPRACTSATTSRDVFAEGRRRQPRGQRPPARDRLEAAEVAAAATTSSQPASRTWPMSPAAPCAPRWIRRPETIPQPMPVPTLT